MNWKTPAVAYEQGDAKFIGFGVKLRKRDLVKIIRQQDEAIDELRAMVPDYCPMHSNIQHVICICEPDTPKEPNT